MNAEAPNAAASQSATPEASPQEILLDMLRVTNELILLHDGGSWAHDDGTPFDPKNTSGYWGMTTCGDDTNRQYSHKIYGPRVSNPEEATAAAAEHFTGQGFTETNKFESSVNENRYLVQTLSHPDGASVVYYAGTGHSSIDVESACSSDPGMDMWTP